MLWLAVACGGALGSVTRYAVTVMTLRLAPQLVQPYATFAVNLLGCLVIGILGGQLLTQTSPLHSPSVRAFVFVGILGGFTTFSAFALDTVTLTHTGFRGLALVNAVGQPVVCLLAAYAGWWLSMRGVD